MNSIRAKLKKQKPISRQNKLFVEAEKRHIQTHLALSELRLRSTRSKKTKDSQKRTTALDTLHSYWRAGIFPINSYKRDERTPVFIDNNGTYCAVGHLMEKTGYGDLAREIDAHDKFSLVETLNQSRVEAWLDEHDLSRKEAALIQPGYGGFVIERVAYSMQDKILAVVTLVASLLLLAFVVIALNTFKNSTVKKPKKLRRIFGLTAGMALIVASHVFYLPSPGQAGNILISQEPRGERVTCSGWNTPAHRRPSICSEYERKGGVPGWRLVPCEGICLY